MTLIEAWFGASPLAVCTSEPAYWVAGEWRVEYFDDDGGCYVAIFAGPAAEQRARDYRDALSALADTRQRHHSQLETCCASPQRIRSERQQGLVGNGYCRSSAQCRPRYQA